MLDIEAFCIAIYCLVQIIAIGGYHGGMNILGPNDGHS
jgi:hypothetical protein